MRKIKGIMRNSAKSIVVAVIMGLMAFSLTSGSKRLFAGETDEVPGVTKDSIKIGQFGPFTGPIAIYGKTAHMATIIYNTVNEMGGVHGRKIVIISEDTACQPVKGVAAVKKLIHQDKVFMLHGGMCSNVIVTAKKEILESGIPFMNLGGGSSRIITPFERQIFTPIFTSVVIGRSMVDFAMSKPGTKRVAVIKHTGEWGMSFYEPIVEWLKEKYGITPVADLDFERGGTDSTPYVLKVKKAKADVLLVVTYPPPTSIILRDSYKLGLRIPIISTSGTGVGEQFEKVGIPEANRYFFAPYWFKYPLDHPKMEKFREMLKKDYPKDKWDVFAPLGIGGAMIVVEALRKVGPDLTREKLIAALETFNKFDKWEPIEYPFSTPTTFSPTDHQGFDYVAFSVMDVDAKKFCVLYDWSDYEKLRKK